MQQRCEAVGDTHGCTWESMGGIPHKLQLLQHGSRSLALAQLEAKQGLCRVQLSKTKLGQWSKREREDDNGHGGGEVVVPG